jgi:hypothetical protein
MRRRSLVRIQSRPPRGHGPTGRHWSGRPGIRVRFSVTPFWGDGPMGRRGLRKPEMGVRFSLIPIGRIAKSGWRRPCKPEVVGSIPTASKGENRELADKRVHRFRPLPRTPHRPQGRGAAFVWRRCRVRSPSAALCRYRPVVGRQPSKLATSVRIRLPAIGPVAKW